MTITLLFRSVQPLAIRRTPLAFLRPTLSPRAILRTRTVASSVSGRPASQTIEQAAINVKEEIGNSTSDLAKRIAGANMTQDAVAPNNTTFVRHPTGAFLTYIVTSL
jgi:hypothetical protein